MIEQTLPGLLFFDEHGQMRSVIGLLEDGTPTIELLTDKAKANLHLKDGIPGLALTDANGENRVVISSGPGEMSHLSLRDTTGANRIVMTLTPTDGAEVWMMDAGGNKKFAIVVDRDGASGLSFGDRQGTPRIGMAIGDDGDAKVMVFDHEGKVVWSRPEI